MKKVSVILLLAVAYCGADQFILLDQDITWNGNGAFDGPFLGQAGASGWWDWTAPVDFTKGCIFSRVEVLEKPTDLSVEIQPCMWDSPPPGESCGTHGPVWTTTGVFYSRIDGPEYWWKKDNQAVDWDKRGRRSLLLIQSGTTKWLDTHSYPHCVGPSAGQHVPIKVHYEMIVTSTTDGTLEIPDELSDWDCAEVKKVGEYWDCEGGSVSASSTPRRRAGKPALSVTRLSRGAVQITLEKQAHVNIRNLRGETVATFQSDAQGVAMVEHLSPGGYIAGLEGQRARTGSMFLMY